MQHCKKNFVFKFNDDRTKNYFYQQSQRFKLLTYLLWMIQKCQQIANVEKNLINMKKIIEIIQEDKLTFFKE